MKQILIALSISFIMVLVACGPQSHHERTNFSSMSQALNYCDGTTVVVNKVYSSSHFADRAWLVVVRDSVGIFREWEGGETELQIGDTLK